MARPGDIAGGLQAATTVDDGCVELSLRPSLRAPGSRSTRRSPEKGVDGALMTRVAAGDLAALGDLVDRHQSALVNYLCRLTKSRERAEELAQEAFVRIYESAPRYRERGAFAAYLFRIATNLLRSEERRSQRWRALVPRLGWHRETLETGATPNPQRVVLADEATEQVSLALNELPLHYRAPLVLREIEGWTYADIATSLECRVGTVKSRINRAKAQLRQRLRPYWESETS